MHRAEVNFRIVSCIVIRHDNLSINKAVILYYNINRMKLVSNLLSLVLGVDHCAVEFSHLLMIEIIGVQLLNQHTTGRNDYLDCNN